jgi:CubicO group peptidase (beta-lactamase class C family)
MTKVPTAIAVLQLYEAGKLDIDDPVSSYLPFFQVEFKEEAAPPVTMRQLLRHTSGLPDIIPAMIGWVHYEDVIYNQTDLLKQHLPRYSELKFAPDSKSAYSNLGYLVLGAIIEAVTGGRYEQYIQDHILTPLGMENTGFLYTNQMAGKIAAGSHPIINFSTPLLPLLLDMKSLVRERVGGQLWFNPLYVDVTPSTGLIGSAQEAALFAQALLTQSNLLSKQSHRLLLPQGTKPDERPLGWADYEITDRLWVQHKGGGPGFASIMRLYPNENLGIVIMSNNTNLPRERLVDAFAAIDWSI